MSFYPVACGFCGVVGDGGESDRVPSWSCSRSAWMTRTAGHLAALLLRAVPDHQERRRPGVRGRGWRGPLPPG
jgi:hypothetical protein